MGEIFIMASDKEKVTKIIGGILGAAIAYGIGSFLNTKTNMNEEQEPTNAENQNNTIFGFCNDIYSNRSENNTVSIEAEVDHKRVAGAYDEVDSRVNLVNSNDEYFSNENDAYSEDDIDEYFQVEDEVDAAWAELETERMWENYYDERSDEQKPEFVKPHANSVKNNFSSNQTEYIYLDFTENLKSGRINRRTI